jgi:carboxypeptidase Taq
VLPFLERAVGLSREYAGFFAPYKHVADPLIDAAEEGMTTASVRSLFAELRSELLPIARAISDQPVPGDDCLRGFFREPAQLDFSLSVVRRFGYDMDRGRLDKTHHPFCAKVSGGDVRITTRVDERHFGQALFSTMHEAGHALYEQGVAAALEGTPLGRGASWGVHESQSRLWENVVGRSRAFWEHFYPVLRDTFPRPVRTDWVRDLLSRDQQGAALSAPIGAASRPHRIMTGTGACMSDSGPHDWPRACPAISSNAEPTEAS